MTLTKEAIAEIAAKIAQNNCLVPDPDEYVRLPKPGSGGRLYGLSRSTLIETGEQCPGLILTLRQKNSQRGIKLLHVPTLKQYLQSLREGEREAVRDA